MKKENRIQTLLFDGVKEGVYPGAVLLVAQEGRIAFLREAGHRLLTPHAEPMNKDTIFDLASLTKPLATTLAIMKLVDQGDLHLDQALVDLLPGPIPRDNRALTPRLLLTHSAGFSDWKPFYLELDRFRIEERKGLLRKRLLDLPLVYKPGDETLYSDLGFMILEWVVEESGSTPMHIFLDSHFYGPLSLKKTFLSNRGSEPLFGKDQFAAKEDCPWRKRIVLSVVHDDNAYAVGGYSGHAGLFGTAEEVYAIVNLLRSHFFGDRKSVV